jgi:hypothetical protein
MPVHPPRSAFAARPRSAHPCWPAPAGELQARACQLRKAARLQRQWPGEGGDRSCAPWWNCPPSNDSATSFTVAAVGRLVLSLQRSLPASHSLSMAARSAAAARSVMRTSNGSLSGAGSGRSGLLGSAASATAARSSSSMCSSSDRRFAGSCKKWSSRSMNSGLRWSLGWPISAANARSLGTVRRVSASWTVAGGLPVHRRARVALPPVSASSFGSSLARTARKPESSPR